MEEWIMKYIYINQPILINIVDGIEPTIIYLKFFLKKSTLK